MVISVRQSTVAAISGLHCRALVMVSSSMSWQPDCKIQRSGRNGQRDWCMSRVTAIIPLWLSASSSACHGLLIITVITPLQNPARQKCQRTEAGERGNYWHADASAWCCCARCKRYTKELADAKAENDALRDDVAAGVVGCTSKQSSVSAWSHHRLRRG